MEESSEKRRERLQAMREDASAHSEPLSSSFSKPEGLDNPLIDSGAGEMTPRAQRFDFYTDPMAAFSSSKRRNPNSGAGFSPESFSSPIRSHSSISYPSDNRLAAVPRNHYVASTHPPGPQFQPNQSPYQSPWRSPIPLQGPFPGNIGGTPPSYTPNTPHSWNQSGGRSPGHRFPPNYSSRGGGFPSPGFSPGGSPSPHPNSGRGSGWQFRGSSSSPRPGRSGGRGRGSYQERGSYRHEQPQHYYIKTMVKDPWRKLKPIVGNILVPRFGSTSWLLKSTAAPKRAKVVESGSKPQLSLAESLALSLEENANEE